MSEPTAKTCSACEAEITTDAAEGLCVACLLQQAALESEAGTGAPAENDPSSSIEAVRRVFSEAHPQLEILEKIGRGGMGTVFKARQPKLDRFVALKILSPTLAGTPAFADRFAREGKLLARLSHPNIVTVYDYGEANGFYYLILEYVDGVNLRQAMRDENSSQQKFTPEQALAIVPKICEALQYAHDEGVLHRDIKPENILLDTRGRLKITDFGIGKLTDRDDSEDRSVGEGISETTNLTDTGQILGTPSYMAPEQREAPNLVDHRADIYSLGVVFYELLTGELPKGRFPLPSEKTPVDGNVDEIVLRALERERDKRFQSAKEMKTQVETATQLFAPVSKTISEETAWDAFRRIPLWMFLFAFFALVFVLPSLASLAAIITDFFSGDLNRSWADIYFAPIPLLIFVTIIWLMRHWRLRPASSSEEKQEPVHAIDQSESPKHRHDLYPTIGIVVLGYAVPILSQLVGSPFFSFKPWFIGLDLPALFFWGILNMIAVGTAIVLFRFSRTWREPLRYLSVIGGYGVLVYFYSWFDIASDAQAAIGLIFIPIYAIPGFVGGFFLGCFFNYLFAPKDMSGSGKNVLYQSDVRINQNSNLSAKSVSWIFPLGFLLASLLLYAIGMVLFVPAKLSLIPARLELGYANASLTLFQPSVEANEEELRLLEPVASEDDPRLLVRLAKKKVDDPILSELRANHDEKQRLFEEARSKQPAWPLKAAFGITVTGILSALISFVLSLRYLIRLRIREEKPGLIFNGMIAFLSPPLIVCGVFFGVLMDFPASGELPLELLRLLILFGIVAAAPVIWFFLWAVGRNGEGGYRPEVLQFSTRCILLSLTVFLGMVLTIYYEEHHVVPPLPKAPVSEQARNLALDAELDAVKIKFQERHSPFSDWKKEFETQRRVLLETIRQEDHRNYQEGFNGEFRRLMHNARAECFARELDLKSLPVMFIILPLFSLCVPGTVLGWICLVQLKRKKSRIGLARALFSSLFWPAAIAVLLTCLLIYLLLSCDVRLKIWPVLAVLGVLAGGLSIWGWRCLARIRKTTEKRGWIAGMMTALFFPSLLFLLGLVIGAAFAGAYSFRGTALLEDAAFFGGLVGAAWAIPLILFGIYRTYRWIFPAGPSPTRLAWWGVALIVLSIFPTLLSYTVDEHFFFTNYSNRLSASVPNVKEEETAVREIESRPQISEAKKKKQIEQIRLIYEYQRQSGKERQKEMREAMERYNRGVRAVFVGGSILASFILAVMGGTFGWQHLGRIAGTSERRGVVPGLIAAFSVTLPAAWLLPIGLLLGPVFLIGPAKSNEWIVAAALLLGNLLGVALVVTTVWLTLRWLRPSGTVAVENEP